MNIAKFKILNKKTNSTLSLRLDLSVFIFTKFITGQKNDTEK